MLLDFYVLTAAFFAAFATRDEREEELEFVRDWWPALVELYAGAERTGKLIVCERS